MPTIDKTDKFRPLSLISQHLQYGMFTNVCSNNLSLNGKVFSRTKKVREFVTTIASAHIASNETVLFRRLYRQCLRTINPNHAHYRMTDIAYLIAKIHPRFLHACIVESFKYDSALKPSNLDVMTSFPALPPREKYTHNE